jgi:predicted nucleic acid-binding protein
MPGRAPVVLDAWPILRYQEGQPKARAEVDRVLADGGLTLVSSINLGEVHYTVAKQEGSAAADDSWNYFCQFASVEAPGLAVTLSAARLVVHNRIPWADAHAAATALAYGGVVWAGDAHLNKPGPWKRRDLRKLGIAAKRGRGH